MASAPTLRLLPWLAALVALAGCGAPGPDHGSLALGECRLPKLSVAARCGTLSVPEDRAQPSGRRIDIFVAVLPANTASPRRDPFVILAGGPGQAASRLAPFASRLAEIRRTRDIVLIDQRGTGRSSPLACEALAPRDDPLEALATDPAPMARECLAELATKGIDPTRYTTRAWIDDLEAVRQAQGYAKLNLWGGSYGSRVALEYLRAYPSHVRSVILDGVAPPDLRTPLDIWPTRERAIDAVLAACEASSACRRAHPDLGATLARIARDLGEGGRVVSVPDPRTGASLEITLTQDAFFAGLLPLTYVPELASLLPEVIERAAMGDYGPLVASARLVGGEISEQTNAALHYSVVCNEDAPRIRAGDRRVLADLRMRSLADKVLAVCDVWPRGLPAPASAEPVASDVPVLILSGALDPVTPPAYGEKVAATLPNSRHIVAGGYGHIVSPHGCAPRLLAAFVADAAFDRLPASCVRHLEGSVRPLLWPDRLAPSP
jgi:pimeloyl-ACP methyl ester carboxylesterase